MTRYLVTGAGGMLGHDLATSLGGTEVTLLSRKHLDITDAKRLAQVMEGHDVVVNLAAYTTVDKAETDSEAARLTNAIGPGLVAAAAAVVGARLIHLSTDYVFDGTASTPYPEDAAVSPVSVYGRSKAEGEQRALAANPDRTWIVRTAWLYGSHGPSFPNTLIRLASQRTTIDVVTDQVGQPTWSMDLAGHILQLSESGAAPGIYHVTNSGQTSRYDFARALFSATGLDPERIRPARSADFPHPAPRPAYSVLGHTRWERAHLPAPRSWEEALRAAVAAGAIHGPSV